MTALVAPSHERSLQSDLLGLHVDLTSLLPKALGTILKTPITHSLPPAHSDLGSQSSDSFDLLEVTNCVSWA